MASIKDICRICINEIDYYDAEEINVNQLKTLVDASLVPKWDLDLFGDHIVCTSCISNFKTLKNLYRQVLRSNATVIELGKVDAGMIPTCDNTVNLRHLVKFKHMKGSFFVCRICLEATKYVAVYLYSNPNNIVPTEYINIMMKCTNMYLEMLKNTSEAILCYQCWQRIQVSFNFRRHLDIAIKKISYYQALLGREEISREDLQDILYMWDKLGSSHKEIVSINLVSPRGEETIISNKIRKASRRLFTMPRLKPEHFFEEHNYSRKLPVSDSETATTESDVIMSDVITSDDEMPILAPSIERGVENKKPDKNILRRSLRKRSSNQKEIISNKSATDKILEKIKMHRLQKKLDKPRKSIDTSPNLNYRPTTRLSAKKEVIDECSFKDLLVLQKEEIIKKKPVRIKKMVNSSPTQINGEPPVLERITDEKSIRNTEYTFERLNFDNEVQGENVVNQAEEVVVKQEISSDSDDDFIEDASTATKQYPPVTQDQCPNIPLPMLIKSEPVEILEINDEQEEPPELELQGPCVYNPQFVISETFSLNDKRHLLGLDDKKSAFIETMKEKSTGLENKPLTNTNLKAKNNVFIIDNIVLNKVNPANSCQKNNGGKHPDLHHSPTSRKSSTQKTNGEKAPVLHSSVSIDKTAANLKDSSQTNVDKPPVLHPMEGQEIKLKEIFVSLTKCDEKIAKKSPVKVENLFDKKLTSVIGTLLQDTLQEKSKTKKLMLKQPSPVKVVSSQSPAQIVNLCEKRLSPELLRNALQEKTKTKKLILKQSSPPKVVTSQSAQVDNVCEKKLTPVSGTLEQDALQEKSKTKKLTLKRPSFIKSMISQSPAQVNNICDKKWTPVDGTLLQNPQREISKTKKVTIKKLSPTQPKTSQSQGLPIKLKSSQKVIVLSNETVAPKSPPPPLKPPAHSQNNLNTMAVATINRWPEGSQVEETIDVGLLDLDVSKLRGQTGPKIEPFSCKICDFTTDNRIPAMNHLHYHITNSLFLYNCALCSYKTSRKVCYVKHFKERHFGSGEKCKLCQLYGTQVKCSLCKNYFHMTCLLLYPETCNYNSLHVISKCCWIIDINGRVDTIDGKAVKVTAATCDLCKTKASAWANCKICNKFYHYACFFRSRTKSQATCKHTISVPEIKSITALKLCSYCDKPYVEIECLACGSWFHCSCVLTERSRNGSVCKHLHLDGNIIIQETGQATLDHSATAIKRICHFCKTHVNKYVNCRLCANFFHYGCFDPYGKCKHTHLLFNEDGNEEQLALGKVNHPCTFCGKDMFSVIPCPHCFSFMHKVCYQKDLALLSHSCKHEAVIGKQEAVGSIRPCDYCNKQLNATVPCPQCLKFMHKSCYKKDLAHMRFNCRHPDMIDDKDALVHNVTIQPVPSTSQQKEENPFDLTDFIMLYD